MALLLYLWSFLIALWEPQRLLAKSRKLLLARSRSLFWPKVPCFIMLFWPKAGSSFGQKPALFWPKAGYFWPERAGFWPGRSRLSPAFPGSERKRSLTGTPGIPGIPGTREYTGIPGTRVTGVAGKAGHFWPKGAGIPALLALTGQKSLNQVVLDSPVLLEEPDPAT